MENEKVEGISSLEKIIVLIFVIILLPLTTIFCIAASVGFFLKIALIKERNIFFSDLKNKENAFL